LIGDNSGNGGESKSTLRSGGSYHTQRKGNADKKPGGGVGGDVMLRMVPMGCGIQGLDCCQRGGTVTRGWVRLVASDLFG